MEESKLKNMVVLKNLPSNLVEEAIIVLKSNKNAKKLEKVDKDKNSETTTNTRKTIEKDFIVKEAEMLLSTYISKIENSKKEIKKTNLIYIFVFCFDDLIFISGNSNSLYNLFIPSSIK